MGARGGKSKRVSREMGSLREVFWDALLSSEKSLKSGVLCVQDVLDIGSSALSKFRGKHGDRKACTGVEPRQSGRSILEEGIDSSWKMSLRSQTLGLSTIPCSPSSRGRMRQYLSAQRSSAFSPAPKSSKVPQV